MSASLEQPGGQRWQITLSNPRVRTLGLLSSPIADIRIEMTGYNQAEIQRFLERFHLVFRKRGMNNDIVGSRPPSDCRIKSFTGPSTSTERHVLCFCTKPRWLLVGVSRTHSKSPRRQANVGASA